jgi:hypothetical protein
MSRKTFWWIVGIGIALMIVCSCQIVCEVKDRALDWLKLLGEWVYK